MPNLTLTNSTAGTVSLRISNFESYELPAGETHTIVVGPAAFDYMRYNLDRAQTAGVLTYSVTSDSEDLFAVETADAEEYDFGGPNNIKVSLAAGVAGTANIVAGSYLMTVTGGNVEILRGATTVTTGGGSTVGVNTSIKVIAPVTQDWAFISAGSAQVEFIQIL